ncbi:MAG: T9SS type A sorting domain-containing protein [Bacteroidia bacterium]|nr:T9SS type A sorting domain-containing protein [Bacteroidia bacterium]
MKKILLSLILFLNTIAFAQLPSYVPTNGLVGFWPFNNNANDLSGNGNNGIVNGAVPTTDRFATPNAAYSYNGVTDYIIVPNSPSQSGFNDMSISVWINVNAFSGIQSIVAKWYQALNCGSNSDTYEAALSGSQVQFATNYTNLTAFSSPPSLPANSTNVWKHLVYISNSTSGGSIYINGVLAATDAAVGTICNSTNSIYFGADYDGNWNFIHRYFNGKIDDIGIWNRVITPCEIQQLYTAGSGTGLISSSTNTLCAGSSATLTALGGASNYLWNTSATTSVIVVSPSVTTTYTVNATSTLTGCSYTAAITQNVSSADVLVSTSNNPICSGASATLIATGNVTSYLWNTSATGPLIVVSPTVTTTYVVFGTNALTGCTASVAITQSVSPFNLTTSSSNSIICPGNSATLTASGGTNYLWSTSATSSAVIVNPTVTTTYTVYGTNAVNGCTASALVTQNVSSPIVSIVSSNSLSCPGNAVSLTVNGNGTSYFWSTSNTGSVIVVNPSVTTSYTVFGTNAVTGCTATASILQNVSTLSLTTASSNNLICPANPATLTASGATNYLWNTSATGPSIIVSPTVTTTYTVVGTNAATGCTATAVFTQSVSSPVASVASSNSVLCAGSSATLTVNGNSTSYFWNTSATNSVIVVSPTVTTIYTVFGTNAITGCTITASITQNVSALPSLTTSSSNSLICIGNPVTLTASGATNYLWSTSATGSAIVVNPTVTTTYTVTGTSTVTGCSNTATITQNVSLCTGIQTNSLNNEINVYPNPTNGLIIINGVKENEDIEVMNVLGALVYKIKATDNKTEIDLSEQKAGVYFVRLKVDNATVTKKIIKE